jgi:hypothetical protein
MRLKTYLKNGHISSEFRPDVCGIQFSFDSGGNLVMERKQDMKKRGLRSPDLADAACLTFYPLQERKSSEMAYNIVHRKKGEKRTGWRGMIGM